MATTAWGSAETQYFFELTPEKILDAVEALGIRCTGRVFQHNSMENRVYEVEKEWEGDSPPSNLERFVIVKFYRPGRWNESQILEEHAFLKDLQEAEVPAVAPIPFSDGTTLKKVPGVDIWSAIFPKAGGRSPDELTEEQLSVVGRLLARMHLVGAKTQAKHRISITPQSYGRDNLKHLIDSRTLPPDIESRYQSTVEKICEISEPLFESVSTQRIHGDCHLGNLLWRDPGLYWVDFDDMLIGPCVQDIWLVVPGRDQDSIRQRNILLEAYEQMKPFDYMSLKLVEPLRALRFIHFSAWISKRWEDPSFKRAFVQFGSARYWQEQLVDLEEQLRLIQAGSSH